VFVAAHLERLDFAAVPASVAYHPSCHLLRGLHVDREPRALLAAIPELDARPLPAEEECCGFGGLFSVKHEDISTRMRERKLANVAACGAERLVSCDMGCLLHLERGVRERAAAARVQHLAELLAEAIR
jgi:L-lactate dehydrogenase complex protein LldE